MGLASITSNAGTEVDEYTGHSDEVQQVIIIGEHGFTGEINGGDIHKWTHADMSQVSIFTEFSQRIVDLNTDGEVLAAGSYDSDARIIDPSDMTTLRTITGHSDRVYGIDITPDHLFTGSDDQTVRKWDRSDGSQVGQFNGHNNGVLNLRLHAGYGFTGGRDNTVRKWNPSDMSGTGDTFTGHSDIVRDIAFYGDYGFSTSNDGSLRKWDIDTMSEVDVWTGGGSNVEVVHVDSPSRFLYVGGEASSDAYKIDMDTLEVVASYSNSAANYLENAYTESLYAYSAYSNGDVKKWYK